jgi:hypothetical protein
MKRTTRAFLKALPLLLLGAPLLTVLVQRANALQAPSWYDPDKRGAKVLGHVPLDIAQFKDALFRENEGRRYLYIQDSGSRQVTIVDVTSRHKPKIAGSIQVPTDAMLSEITFKGDVAIVTDAKPPTPAKTPQPAAENITIWDYSKPGSPRVSQTFTGVKRVISGQANVVYVLDSQGLWIVQIYDQERRDWDYYVDHIGG